MRGINVNKVRDTVEKLCKDANIYLRKDIEKALKKAFSKERNKRSRSILGILLENAYIAKKEKRAICQDTGVVTVYLTVGQNVKFTGGDLEHAINKGVKRAYKKSFFRKSVIKSPIVRTNTTTNTPCIITVNIVKGNKVKITVVPKGFGSENKSKLVMLNPTAEEKEIIDFILDTVKNAGADGCPPYVLGIGIGGTFDKAAFLAKKALTFPVDKKNPKRYLGKLEKKILKKVNTLNIGPMGLGGKVTCLGVNILEYPTHIAGLPLAVNVSCHATRSASSII